MTDAAGTPEPKPDDTKSGTPEPGKDDSGPRVEVSAQFKDQALKEWKPAAEEANRLRVQLAEKDAQLQELARRAYGGQAATDPRMELIAKLQEQAQYDPVAQATLMTMQDSVVTKAENWLTSQLLDNEVPKAKRDGVSSLIRASGYQMSVQDALSKVTDPESKTLADQVAELRKENDRLKNAKPNGSSPASAIPANTDSGEGRQEPIKRADYIATLRQAAAPGATPDIVERARNLKRAVGEGKRSLVDD